MNNALRNVLLLNVIFAHRAIFAQEAAAPAGPGSSFLINLPIFIAMFALFYFVLIRPQKQQQKKHQELLSKLKVSDEVLTSSGIMGTIRGLNERVCTLEISDEVEIKIMRSQIQGLLKESLEEKATKA